MGSIANYSASVFLNRKDGTDGIDEILLDVSTSIYYYENNDDDDDDDDSEGSNETQATFKITQKFIESLKPGDELVLTGDGNCQ